MKTAVILTFSKVYNRGANIQCFALSKTLQAFGYNVRFLDIKTQKKQNIKGLIFSFISDLKVSPFRANNGFSYTRPYDSYEDLIENPPSMDVLVIGSDQVWNNSLTLQMQVDPRIYYGGFAKGVTKISYAASFGTDKWYPTQYDAEIVKAVQELSAIGVREESGIRICKEVFQRGDVCDVIDPSLLLSRDDLDSLIGNEIKKEKRQFGYVYLLHRDDETEKIVDDIIEKSKRLVKGYSKSNRITNLFEIESIPSWLANIRDAEYVVTNSFHCMAMCILFHKNFYAIPSSAGKEIRMTSLLEKLHISDRYFNKVQGTYPVSEIDYIEVDKILISLKKKSLAFLADALG